jgi:nucleotide-binding universal stress UspA family protein
MNHSRPHNVITPHAKRHALAMEATRLSSVDAALPLAPRSGGAAFTIVRKGGEPKIRLKVIAARADKVFVDFWARLGRELLIRTSNIPVLVAHAELQKRYRRILVPVDFSDAARESARLALRLWPAAQVVFLHAFRVPDEDGDSGEDECSRSLRAHEAAMLELRRFCGGLVPADRLVSLVVHRGAPVPVISDYARKMDADLVAVGRKRQSRLSGLFHRSAARRFVDQAACDVLVVPSTGLG